MKYRIVSVFIQGDGSVIEGERPRIIYWPAELEVGGLYYLSGGRIGSPKLYKVLEVME